MISRSLTALALACAPFTLTACGDAPAEAPAEESGIPGMTISNPRMVLAPVSGNPAAVYFDLDYQGDRNVALNRAEVKGAKSATFHDYGEYDMKVQMMDMLPVPLKKGDKISFEPGGKHIMAMEPDDTLKPGGTAEVTIIVSGGKGHTFEAPIRAAGDER